MAHPTLPSSRRPFRAAALVLLLAGVGLAGSRPAAAAPATSAPPAPAAVHEVPADVAVQAYLRPRGSELTTLLRVPLESMRDVDLPLRDGGRYLDLTHPELERRLRDAARIWIAGYLAFREDGRDLGDERVEAVRLSLPSDRSFSSWEGARAHLDGADPVPPGTDLPPGQALLDVRLSVPVRDPGARFSLEPALAHLGVETVSVLHFLPPGGGERVFRYEGDPGWIELDPRWHQAVLRFVDLGFRHILGGLDHLLFVLCLVVPFGAVGRRSLRGLVGVVTAFTVAHSVTLGAAALGMTPSALWFPPLVEALIALSILWMALENIVGARLSRRWAVAFGFGLVHGFGFSFVLSESLQFAGGHLLESLVAFNVGVELGQVAVLLALVPLLGGLYRVVGERMGVVLVSALVAHTAWHWTGERGAAFLAHDVRLPAMDAAFWAGAMRWAALLLVCLGVAWGLSALLGPSGRWAPREGAGEAGGTLPGSMAEEGGRA